MPSKNIIKSFDTQSMYHVYNRGNDKRVIFHDERDYAVFLSFLKYALLSDDDNKAKNMVDSTLISQAQQFNLRRLGLAGKLELVAFCLMPNHFHLLLYQSDIDSITKLMRSLATGYSMYYNKRYNRIGSLYQGVYKAKHIDNDAYWDHISRYIHLNPVDLNVDYRDYNYSSFRYYIKKADSDWVNPEKGLSNMNISQYEKFVSNWIPHRKNLAEIKKFLAE